MGRFKKGLFFGSLLGAGVVWLSTTRKGKEVRDQLLDYAADVYTQVREKILASDAFEAMTKNQYVAYVKDVVDKYAMQNKLAENVKKMVIRLVTAQWDLIQAELKKKRKK